MPRIEKGKLAKNFQINTSNIKNPFCEINYAEFKILDVVKMINEEKDELKEMITKIHAIKKIKNIYKFICKKKIKGSIEEKKEFIINYCDKVLDEANKEVKFFNDNEEDKTNKQHLVKRRKIIENINHFNRLYACIKVIHNYKKFFYFYLQYTANKKIYKK